MEKLVLKHTGLVLIRRLQSTNVDIFAQGWKAWVFWQESHPPSLTSGLLKAVGLEGEEI